MENIDERVWNSSCYHVLEKKKDGRMNKKKLNIVSSTCKALSFNRERNIYSAEDKEIREEYAAFYCSLVC